jgi:hypothetical protein
MEFFDTSIVEQIEMKMIRSSQFAVRDRFNRMSDDDFCLIASIREHGLCPFCSTSCGFGNSRRTSKIVRRWLLAIHSF